MAFGAMPISAKGKLMYFVTPHAVTQFRRRVANIHPANIISIILAELSKRQRVIENGRQEKIYAGRYFHHPFYAIVVDGEGEWPAIATVLGKCSKLHGQICKKKAIIITEE